MPIYRSGERNQTLVLVSVPSALLYNAAPTNMTTCSADESIDARHQCLAPHGGQVTPKKLIYMQKQVGETIGRSAASTAYPPCSVAGDFELNYTCMQGQLKVTRRL
eukprot:6179266-Pleurochrysis_carterae.AAC.1